MAYGIIKKYIEDRGFGFIQPEDGGKELFFHCKFVKGPQEALREGRRVSFIVKQGDKGPAAEQIEIID